MKKIAMKVKKNSNNKMISTLLVIPSSNKAAPYDNHEYFAGWFSFLPAGKLEWFSINRIAFSSQ